MIDYPIWNATLAAFTSNMRATQSSSNMSKSFIFALLMLACITASFAEGEKPIVLRVTRVVGQARTSTDGKNWRAIKKGNVFVPGAILQTAVDGIVDIRVDAGRSSHLFFRKSRPGDPALRIQQSSVLKFAGAARHSSPDSSSQLDKTNVNLELNAGSLIANVETNSTCECRIKIHSAVEVIGTGHFYLSASGRLSVLSGSMKMTNLPSNYHDVVVTSGHEFVFGEGVVVLSPAEEYYLKNDHLGE